CRLRRRRRLWVCCGRACGRAASSGARNLGTRTASGGGNQKRALAAGTIGVCAIPGEASNRSDLHLSGTPAKNKRRNRGIIRSLAHVEAVAGVGDPGGILKPDDFRIAVHRSLITDHQSPAPSTIFPSSARGIHKRAEIRSDLKK